MSLRLSLTLICFWAFCGGTPGEASVLYGGLGGHNNGDSTNDGSLALVNQTNGSVSVIGHPAGVSRISGLVFGLDGVLYGATQGAGGFPPPPGPTTSSNLIQIDPGTGALIKSVPITAGGVGISIADLALQPGTGVLYGIRGPNDQLGSQGNLYTIDPTTGVATLIGNTGDFFASIGFAPDGTLYMSAADLDFQGNFTNIALKRLNPTNAAVLSSVATSDFFGALAVRPEDGAIFGGTGDSSQLFTINPATGAETLIGNTGRTFVGDLAFTTRANIPEPGTLVLFAAGLGVLWFVSGAGTGLRRPEGEGWGEGDA